MTLRCDTLVTELKFSRGCSMKPRGLGNFKIIFRSNPRWPTAGQIAKITSVFQPRSHCCRSCFKMERDILYERRCRLQIWFSSVHPPSLELVRVGIEKTQKATKNCGFKLGKSPETQLWIDGLQSNLLQSLII